MNNLISLAAWQEQNVDYYLGLALTPANEGTIIAGWKRFLNNPALWIKLADYYDENNQSPEALSLLRKAFFKFPQSPDIIERCATSHFETLW